MFGFSNHAIFNVTYNLLWRTVFVPYQCVTISEFESIATTPLLLKHQIYLRNGKYMIKM